MTGPLSSLKILDFTTLLPGPYATMWLADLGADVVRVESPTRPDIVRFKPPLDGDASVWHRVINRSKRSLVLDLKQPQAADVVRRLVQVYDILLEQFRPGVMARLGVGYHALRDANPTLIYVSITGYGQTGPYRSRAGHDINYLALSGIIAHSGRRATHPPPLGVQLGDVGGGAFPALVSLLAAVIHRRETGQGQHLDVSMFDSAMNWNALAAADALAGEEPEPEASLLNGGTYYDYYRTRDGRYLAVGCLEPKFWRRFCHAIGREELAPRGLRTPPGHQLELKLEIQKTLATRSLAEWMAIFADVDACVEPVLSVTEALEHPQTQARGLVVDVPRSDGGTTRQVGHPVKYSQTPPSYRHAGTDVGAATGEILRGVGFENDEIRRLQQAGVFGQQPIPGGPLEKSDEAGNV